MKISVFVFFIGALTARNSFFLILQGEFMNEPNPRHATLTIIQMYTITSDSSQKKVWESPLNFLEITTFHLTPFQSIGRLNQNESLQLYPTNTNEFSCQKKGSKTYTIRGRQFNLETVLVGICYPTEESLTVKTKPSVQIYETNMILVTFTPSTNALPDKGEKFYFDSKNPCKIGYKIKLSEAQYEFEVSFGSKGESEWFSSQGKSIRVVVSVLMSDVPIYFAVNTHSPYNNVDQPLTETKTLCLHGHVTMVLDKSDQIPTIYASFQTLPTLERILM